MSSFEKFQTEEKQLDISPQEVVDKKRSSVPSSRDLITPKLIEKPSQNFKEEEIYNSFDDALEKSHSFVPVDSSHISRTDKDVDESTENQEQSPKKEDVVTRGDTQQISPDPYMELKVTNHTIQTALTS